MTWTYSQSTGEMARDGVYLCRGYAGFKEGKNQGSFESVHDIGPIPRGRWTITALVDPHPRLGKFCLYLTPGVNTITFGRDQFFIHGDSLTSPGNASHGCIIIGPMYRQAIWRSGDRELEVTA